MTKLKFVRSISMAIVLLFTSTFSMLAHSEQGWVMNVKITRLVATFNGGINVRVTPELTSCTSQSGYGPAFASLYPDHLGFKNIHAILLAAYMGDKPISIYLTDSTCKVGEVLLGTY